MSKEKLEFTIGTDPEFFIEDKKGKLHKSSKFTKGDKDELEDLGDGFSCHADNVMLELNLPPVSGKIDFIRGINTGKGKLEALLGKDHSLLVVPSVVFDEMDLTDEQDFEVGCQPDYNAYTEDLNEAVSLDTPSRYAGGHVHVGFVEVPDTAILIKMIKALDFVLAPFVMEKDKDTERKEIYGTPGRFRPKPYGFEYRALSNFWLASDTLISELYELVDYALNNYEKYSEPLHQSQVEEGFQKTINVNCPASERDIIVYGIEDPIYHI